MKRHDPPLLEKRHTRRVSSLSSVIDFDNSSRIYLAAARKLLEAHDNGVGTLWDMPLIFLYRHAIELAIKGVLSEASRQPSTIRIRKVKQRGHDLKAQLVDIEIVARYSSFSLSADFEKTITIWTSEDPQGMIARYPEPKDSEEKLTLSNAQQFDLGKLVAAAEGVLSELAALRESLLYEKA